MSKNALRWNTAHQIVTECLLDQGYLLHTASGAVSFEIAGYLEAVGVRSCFGRCYGADLINTFKQGLAYFERLFADLNLIINILKIKF